MKVKELNKIKKRINSTFSTLVNTQFIDSNWPKVLPKNSYFSKILNIKEEKLSDLKSIARLEYDFKLDEKVDFFSEILTLDVN